MAEKNKDAETNEAVLRIYEVGYHVSPSVKEEDVEKVVTQVRDVIEKVGGSFIAEAAPTHTKLSYPISVRQGERYSEYDRAYFGWIKFEADTQAAKVLTDSLTANKSILRALVFKTLREDTRAKFKAPQIREVKRTDTLKAAPRKAADAPDAAPVSEVDLEKALETLTAE